MIRKAIAYEELRSNFRCEIFVEDITDSKLPEPVRQEFFDVIMHITYETKLRKSRFLFACVPTLEQENNLMMQNTEYEDTWMMTPNEIFPNTPDDISFQMLQISVDNIPLSSVSERKNEYLEIICEHPSLSEKIGEEVNVSYTFRVKAERVGHVIYTVIQYPTYDVTIEFNFAKASIDYVYALDYFSSVRRATINYIPDDKHPYKISVKLKEWVFPKGGVVFTWVLKEEETRIQELRRQLQLKNAPKDSSAST